MLGPSSSPAPTTLAALFIATCQQRCCAVCLFTLACQIAMMLYCKCLSTLSPTSIARQCDCNSCTSSTAIALEPFLLPSRWKWICCFLYAHDEWSVFAARLVAPDQRIYLDVDACYSKLRVTRHQCASVPYVCNVNPTHFSAMGGGLCWPFLGTAC